MNEEETRAKLRTRLEGWQAYLREQDPTSPEDSVTLESRTPTEAQNTTLAEAEKSAALFESGQRGSDVSQSNAAPIPNRSSVKIVTLVAAPLSFPSDAGFDEEEDCVVPLPAYSLQRFASGHARRLKVVFLAIALFAIVTVSAILYEMYVRFDW